MDAVRILCLDVFKRAWAVKFDWGYWNDAAQPLESTHPTIARELPLETEFSGNACEEANSNYGMSEAKAIAAVRTRHPEVIKALKTRIRTRHQSIHTEQTYEYWICRFIIFNKMKDPRTMADLEVVRFLEYYFYEETTNTACQICVR